MKERLDSKQSILVVDDDEDVLLLMRLTLQKEGYLPVLSPNGKNMMDIIAQAHPDLVLLDIHMKGLDGQTICQLLKSNETTAGIPIVMFSANDNIEEITRECGADAYIRKPFENSRLKETFHRILDQPKARNE